MWIFSLLFFLFLILIFSRHSLARWSGINHISMTKAMKTQDKIGQAKAEKVIPKLAARVKHPLIPIFSFKSWLSQAICQAKCCKSKKLTELNKRTRPYKNKGGPARGFFSTQAVAKGIKEVMKSQAMLV